MKFWLISITFTVLSAVCNAQTADSALYNNPPERQTQTLKRFNPIYGNEEESNNIIAFISSNLVVELSPESVKDIDGFVACSFLVDTMGNMKNIKIVHSLKPWIDYAIMGAMTRLPNWGRPCIRRDKKVEKRFDVVFSFGSFIKPMEYMGFNGPKVDKNIQSQITQQRTALQKELAVRKNKWDGFTKENAKLEYDNQGALRKNQPILPGSNTPLSLPDMPSSGPTIKVTSKE